VFDILLPWLLRESFLVVPRASRVALFPNALLLCVVVTHLYDMLDACDAVFILHLGRVENQALKLVRCAEPDHWVS
jgi:hypothetical protein